MVRLVEMNFDHGPQNGSTPGNGQARQQQQQQAQ